MSTIIFDFDGTIADSMWVILAIAEELLGITVPAAEVEQIRDQSAMQVIKQYKVPLWKAPRLLTQGKRMMRERLHEVKVFDGMVPLLETLQAEGHTMRIMSSNSQRNVQAFLDEHNLTSYFASIDGSVGLFVKAPALRKIIRHYEIDKDNVYYVGDEARDIEGAKKAGVPIVAVGWGYNSPRLLKSMQPDFFAAKPADIAKVIGRAQI
jgi:phosphoglycolate phosphatase